MIKELKVKSMKEIRHSLEKQARARFLAKRWAIPLLDGPLDNFKGTPEAFVAYAYSIMVVNDYGMENIAIGILSGEFTYDSICERLVLWIEMDDYSEEDFCWRMRAEIDEMIIEIE